jgi:hypothetical protein
MRSVTVSSGQTTIPAVALSPPRAVAIPAGVRVDQAAGTVLDVRDPRAAVIVFTTFTPATITNPSGWLRAMAVHADPIATPEPQVAPASVDG